MLETESILDDHVMAFDHLDSLGRGYVPCSQKKRQ
jgi:hypothetical protein